MSGGLASLAARAQGGFADPQAWRDLLGSEDPAAFSQAWLKLLVSTIDQALAPHAETAGAEPMVLGGFVAMRLGTAQRYTRTATYGGGEVSFLLAKAAERCLQVRRPVGQMGGQVGGQMGGQAGGGTASPEAGSDIPAQIAVPIMVAGEMEAIVALELRAAAEPQLDRATRLAQWGTAWFARIIGPRDAVVDRNQSDLVVKALAIAAADGSLPSVAQTLCSFLADRLGLMRVSLGAAERGPQHVIATSRGSLAEAKTDFLVALAAALDEAISANAPLLFPVPEAQIAAIGAHERLCRSHNATWAASVPITVDRLTFVMCFEGTGPAPDPQGFLAWQELTRLLAPMLALRHQAQRGLAAHTGSAVVHVARDWTLDGDRTRWAGLALAIVAVLVLAFARGDDRVAGRATLEGAVKRAVVAPFDGYLAEARVRPGERVRSGEVLARLDDRELRLQALDFKARIAEAQHQVTESVGRHEMAAAAISTARRQQSEAELHLVENNIARAEMTAPFDALVIAGDPTQQIGAPLRRGELIYELSPLNSFRVAVDVDEADLADIQPGQTGRLLLSSLPYDVWPMTVTRVTPIASAKDGKTMFRVDGDLSAGTEADAQAMRSGLRPGMQGVAKIEIGERRLVWIWSHAMLSWARLKLWEWLP